MKKLFVYFVVLTVLLSGCNYMQTKNGGTQIDLSDNQITVDGKAITDDSTQPVYSARDIVFYLADQDFTYGEGTKEDAHTQNQADAHTVVHITKPGNYIISGALSLGQIAVDLGEEAESDPEAVVTLILNGVDITCEVAPAIIFYNVYECCSSEEDAAIKDVDTKSAGANVIISDNTENNITGSYVAKIYKSYELSEDGKEVVDSKKLHKYDGAFYSKKTLNISGGVKGNGILNINAENEGLCSELHLTVNGGIINITSGNDGINTNEDNVSVTTVNGGTLNILCDGSTGEGDGIDSNGWLVIGGGTVIAQACSTSGDAGIDSDRGIYINAGTVIATGNMLDRIAGGDQTYAVFSFASRQKENSAYALKDADGTVVQEYTPANAFSTLIVAGDRLIPGDYTFWQGDTQLSASQSTNIQGGMPQGPRPEIPTNEQNEQGTPPEIPGGTEHPHGPDGMRPEMPNGENPQGVRPERPEGMNGMIPPDKAGTVMDGEMLSDGETSTTFTVVKGANQFVNVCAAS